MTDTRYSEKFTQAYEQYEKEHPKPVILVAGATGSGKSSLINLVLNLPEEKCAKTGSGVPVTQKMEKFEDGNIIVFDSKGYETGEEQQEAFFTEIKQFIEERKNSEEAAVNIIWYCISTPSARILDVDINVLRFFAQQGIPTALVLTQVDVASEEDAQALKKIAHQEFPDLDIFESSLDVSVQLPAGIDHLYQWTLDHLDATRRTAFFYAANRDLAQKLTEGESIIRQHTLAAFGIGFTPIPVADAPLLIADQMTLLARLSTLWGLTSLKETLIGGGLLDMVMSQLGKSIAGNLLKLLPGVGSLAGGMINGSVGAALTWALGTAVNTTSYKICQAQLRGERIVLTDYFNNDFIKLIMQLITEAKNRQVWK